MAERMGEELLRDYGVDFVAGPDAYMDIPNLLALCEQEQPALNIQLSTTETYREVMPARIGKTISGFVSIMRGCNNFCSYCIIPYVRGRVRSRNPESVIKEIAEIAGSGIKEVVITGIHVASYGKDFKENIVSNGIITSKIILRTIRWQYDGSTCIHRSIQKSSRPKMHYKTLLFLIFVKVGKKN